jgi:hypothetical protein
MKSLEDCKITLGKAYDLIRKAVNDDTVAVTMSLCWDGAFYDAELLTASFDLATLKLSDYDTGAEIPAKDITEIYLMDNNIIHIFTTGKYSVMIYIVD